MEIIFFIALGFIVGGLIILAYYRYQFYRFEKRVNEITAKIMKDSVIEMEIDFHDNEYFAYDFNTKEFLCKGVEYTELAKAFETRFPDKRGAIKRYLNCSTIKNMPSHLKMDPDES